MYIGIAVSAYQIEGNNIYSDWYYFERLGKLPKNEMNLWEKLLDIVDILKDLEVNAFRFSIEWSRIYPERDRINYSALRKYIKFVEKLKENNIEPFITLWHFTNPKWFLDLGGWEKEENIEYFLDYIETIKRNIECNFWITLNEPFVYSLCSYFLGIWPPFKKVNSLDDLEDFIEVLRNLYKAHEEAYKILKDSGKVGICINVPIIPTRYTLFVKELINLFFFKIPKVDFVGLNYYGRVKKLEDFLERRYKPYPKGLKKVCEKLYNLYKVPVFITENGINTENEKQRVEFIRRHLRVVKKLKSIVNGYFYWTLVDCYEWEIGHKAFFGLMSRDLKPKRSFFEFKRLIKEEKILQ